MLVVSRKSLLPSLALSVCLVCLAPARCAAWGSTAHRIIARIAFLQLSPVAKARVAHLLVKENFVKENFVEENFIAVSTYADEIRLLRPETASWHFVDIPASASTYVSKRDCIGDDCLVSVVERFARVLSDPKADDGEKSEALKFLIHFVGDLSQPFHCYDNNDKGGNLIAVKFGGKVTNLHAVWDTYMIERMVFGVTTEKPNTLLGNTLLEIHYAGQLMLIMQFGLNDPKDWGGGKPEDWAVESHQLALKAVNLKVAFTPTRVPVKPQPSRTPVSKKRKSNLSDEAALSVVQSAALQAGKPTVSTALEITDSYYAVNSKIVEQQLLKAGLRLARLLNEAFDKTATR